jgi:signal transduction histidine kinase
MAAVRPDADQVKVQINIEPLNKPIFLPCSEGVLSSIILNLIRNALKYILDGLDSVRYINIRVRDLVNFVRVEVEDNGPGIEPGKLKSIFEPYFRASTSRPGLGLGLATVKRFVEAHGGKLGVSSHLGKGSCFWFELPKA